MSTKEFVALRGLSKKRTFLSFFTRKKNLRQQVPMDVPIFFEKDLHLPLFAPTESDTEQHQQTFKN